MKLIFTQKGAEIVEFALMLPFLLVMLFGIMEFGIVLYDQAVITNASREAARSGIAYKCPAVTESFIKGVVTTYTTTGTDVNATSLLVSFPTGTTPVVIVSPSPPTTTTNCYANSGTALTVNVSYQYNFLALGKLMSLLNLGFTNPINLSATTVMNYE
jgi:Flp pilus assembly protein TadG